MKKKFFSGVLSLVICISIIFGNIPVYASGKGNCNFTGYVGVTAVRDTEKSPLTTGEILTGRFMEFVYVTYNEAKTIVAAHANYNYFQTLIESLGINAATAAICSYMGWATIPSVVVGTAMSLGYAILVSLSKAQFTNCYHDMSSEDMIKISFYLSRDSGLSRLYNVYEPLSFTAGTDGYNNYLIENPGDPTYYDWHAGVLGVNFKIGV